MKTFHLNTSQHSNAACIRCKVSDDGIGWKWDVTLADFTPETTLNRELVQELKDRLSNLRLNNRKKVVEWRWFQSKMFSVKSIFYNFLEDGVSR